MKYSFPFPVANTFWGVLAFIFSLIELRIFVVTRIRSVVLIS